MLAYGAGCLDAAHDRHLHVHEHEVVVSLRGVRHGVDGLLPVDRLVDVGAQALNELRGYLEVQQVVLHHQHASLKVHLGWGARVLGGAARVGEKLQHVVKARFEQGLRYKSRYAGSTRLLFYLVPIVGGQQHDGRGVAHFRADAADGLDAVHARHDPVHDDEAVVMPLMVSAFDQRHGIEARRGRVAAQAELVQDKQRALDHVRIVVHQQHASFLQAFEGEVLLLVEGLEGHRHDEGGPLARGAFHLDGASHHVHDVLRDGHAQTGALDPLRGVALLPLEGVEQALQEFRRHAQARVLHHEAVVVAAGPVRRPLAQREADRPAVGRVLDGVAHQVDERLVQPHGIAHHVFLLNGAQGDVERQVLRLGLGLGDGDDPVDEVGEAEAVLVEDDLAAFYLAHVQHVVDEA